MPLRIYTGICYLFFKSEGASFIKKIMCISAIMCGLIFLVSCQSSENNQEETTGNEAGQDAQNNNNEEEEEDPYAYSTDPYEIEVESEGDIFTEYIGDLETDEDDDAYEKAQEESIDALVEKIEEMDSEEYNTPEKVAGIIINELRTEHATGLDKL